MRASDLFEHQISNPTEVRKYVATAVGQVTNADAAKWLHVALSRHINNSDTNFLVPFSKKMSDYLDDEVKPHMATIKDLRTFVSPDILRTTEYELVDDYDTEETIGILEQQTRDVTAWLNAGGKYQGLPFNIAAKRAGAWVRDEVLRSGLNDVTPVLELGNGWRWVRLNSEAAARAEGYAMKNCLRHDIKKFHTGDHANPLYSLRDRKNMPHVNYGGDGEPFGIANSDVKQQYLPAIEALEEYLENPKPLWGSEETAAQKRSREATDAEVFLTQMNIGGRGDLSESDDRKHWKFWINVKTGQCLDCRDGGEFNDHCGYALAHQEQFGHDLKSLLPEREVERIIAGKSYSGASSGTIFDRVCPEGWVRVYYGSRLRTLALEGDNIRMLAKAIRIFSKRFPDLRRVDMDTRTPFQQRYGNGVSYSAKHRTLEHVADIEHFIQKGVVPSF